MIADNQQPMPWRQRYSFDNAANLKAWRRAAGWSQMDLARASSVNVSTVKYHEAKSGRIGGWAGKRFREAFEVAKVLPPKTSSPDQFLGAMKQCGAKTRKGSPCRAKAMPGRNRCKFHGGMSTGPKSIEGRARIAEAQRQRWRQYRCDAASAG